MALALPSPGLHRPQGAGPDPPARRVAPATAGGRAPGVMQGAVTIACALIGIGYLIEDAVTTPSVPGSGPVAVQVSGSLDTPGLVGGGTTTSELTVMNQGGAPLRWSWQPALTGPRVAIGALQATASLGRCPPDGAAVALPPGRDAPLRLHPGEQARLCVRLVLPEAVGGTPVDVAVRIAATPAGPG